MSAAFGKFWHRWSDMSRSGCLSDRGARRLIVIRNTCSAARLQFFAKPVHHVVCAPVRVARFFEASAVQAKHGHAASDFVRSGDSSEELSLRDRIGAALAHA